MDEAPAVVVVGAACRDLVDDDERGWRLGGGASYSALALARLGIRVGALVVADELASTSRELNTIRDAGVDVLVVPGSRGPIFINIETPTGRIQQTPQVSDAGRPAGAPARLAGRRGLDVRAGRRRGPRRVGGRPAPGCARGARLAGPAPRAPGRRARPPPAARAVARRPARGPGRRRQRRRGRRDHAGASRRVHASGSHAAVHGRRPRRHGLPGGGAPGRPRRPPLAQHPDPEVRGPRRRRRHVPVRRLRGAGWTRPSPPAGTARTRTCASGRRAAH